MRLKTILTVVCLWLSATCYSQAGRFFTVDRELSSSLINKIYQDKSGVIWIATEDGLNCYDGAKFTAYKNDQDDDSSLINNYVRVVSEDSGNRILIGTLSGLQIYDPVTDRFKTILMELIGGGFVFPNVSSIIERKDGKMLIGTSGHGIFEIEEEDGEMKAVQIDNPAYITLITYLFEDAQENLWVATEDKGLYRLEHGKSPKNFLDQTQGAWNSVSCICQDNNGEIYVGTMDKGLYRHNRSTDSFSRITKTDNPDLPIKTLYPVGSDKIYIGTDGLGLKSYDIKTGSITEGQLNISAFDSGKSKVHTIVKDNFDNYWLGFYQKGVAIIPSSTNNFNYIGSRSSESNFIGSSCVMSLCKDYTGTIWVGTDNDGIYGIAPNGRLKAHYQHSYSSKSESVPATIMSIFEDSNHTIWLGSYLSGMARFDPQSGRCYYVENLIDSKQNTVQRVYCFAEDDKKQLWIGTMGSGLYKMNLNTNDIERLPDNNNGLLYHENDNVLHNLWINCLCISNDNKKLYIGTFDGVGCLDLETSDFVVTFERNRLLAGKAIYAIHEDPNGGIWAGSSDGLFRINPQNGESTRYTVKDGLAGNVVCAIHGDGQGNLWISTDYGMSRFNIKDRNFDNYYASNGLQGNEFSKGASFSDGNNIYFGGINGITFFDPSKITNAVNTPQVHITDFYLNDIPVRKGMKSGQYEILDTSVRDARRFELSRNDDSFTIEFSTMEFNNPERITFMYTMDEDNWTSLLPGINRVSFSNLSPGSYTFRIRAKDYTALSDIKTITIVIHPAWYASTAAKMFYALLLLLAGWFVFYSIRHRYATRQQLLEHQHAEQMNEAKLQFFMNVSHEIRTPMSLIISPLQKLISTDKDAVRQKSYRTIYRNSQRILNLINQLMDIRKIDKGQMDMKFREIDIVAFVRDLCNTMDYQMETKNITLDFHSDHESLNMWVDPKNFDKIVLNLLSNAFKFTPEGGKIDVRLSTSTAHDANGQFANGCMELAVSDNGIGIADNDKERIFERFYQVHNSLNTAQTGTGIGLNLVHMLVELHHGTISVKNNSEGHGTCFTVKIPMGNEHLKTSEIDNVVNPSEIVHNTDYMPFVPNALPEQEEEKVKSKSKFRILVVEDDEEIRQYLMNELSSSYHIKVSPNGKDALEKILKEEPDLVISDIMMPEMDGTTLCKKIKQNININSIPVVLLTAKTSEEDYLEGLEIGADAYIAKPFNMDVVRKTIENILRRREMLKNCFSGRQEQEAKKPATNVMSADDKLMERIMNTINNQLDNPKLTVEMIADEVGISRVHLHRKLKELTNQSTRDFIRNVRLKQAALLLTDKKYNVTETAYLTGFTHITIFSRAFKEFYGVTPSVYIDEHNRKADHNDSMAESKDNADKEQD